MSILLFLLIVYILFLLLAFCLTAAQIELEPETFCMLSIILFAMLTIGYIFWEFGVNNYTIGGVVIISIIAVVLLILISYCSSLEKKQTVVDRISDRGLIQLRCDYDRSDQRIATRFGDIFNSHTLKDFWRIAMCTDKETFKLMLGGQAKSMVEISDNILFDLCWYLTICDNPTRLGFTVGQISYILRSTDTQLLDYLGEDFNGATDRASLLFSTLTGYIVPKIDYSVERYQQIKDYPPQTIYNLAFLQGNIIDEEKKSYKLSGPYIYLSTLQENLVETIIREIDQENYRDLIEKLGIGPINNISTMSDKDIRKYLQVEVSCYSNIFSRPNALQLPPSLNNIPKEEVMHILSFYTNIELINAYEPRVKWNSRIDLLSIICDDLLGIPRWSIYSTSYCNNDDSINIITGETHKEINKEDRDDPTLSFGKHKDYSCYQVSELEASFDIHDGIFVFGNPDWRPNTVVNKEFSLDSMKQLYELLDKEQQNYNITGLMDKIDSGIKFMKSAKAKMQQLKNKFYDYSDDQKQIVKLYLGWMFLYSMWMRFWKGPGTPWPMIRVNIENKMSRDKARRSSPKERDEHIFIQDGVKAIIIEMYEKDEELKDFIENLPTIYYDFETLEMTCAVHTIKETLDKISLGDYCMGFGSDTILKTAYCYITCFLGYHEGYALDNFLSKIIPILCDIEHSYINRQNISDQTPIRFRVFNNRLLATNQVVLKQENFNSRLYQNNSHTE